VSLRRSASLGKVRGCLVVEGSFGTRMDSASLVGLLVLHYIGLATHPSRVVGGVLA
jgi:hypothetical protein